VILFSLWLVARNASTLLSDSLPQEVTDVGSNRLMLNHDDTMKQRVLASTTTTIPMFSQQDCNRNLDWNSCALFSAQGYDYNKTVVIPCGQCVTFDVWGELKLPMGLDVQGALQMFVNFHSLHLYLPFLRVQGNLHITTGATVITDTPSLRITLTGTNETRTQFVPAGINQNICSSQSTRLKPCQVGTKPFVVAGGQLNIQGLPSPNCPSWHNLINVATVPLVDLLASKATNFFLDCSSVLDKTSYDSSSNVYSLYPECLHQYSIYKVSLRVRAPDTVNPVGFNVELRSRNNNNRKDFQIAKCPKATQTDWIICESQFVLQTNMINGYDTFQVQLEWDDKYIGDVEVKDWNITFLEGPVMGLVLPRDVAGCWGDGAEILVTSHTTDYKDHQVRRLQGTPFPNPKDRNTYILPLDRMIIRPTTLEDSADFAVEVALLSRNIVVEGAKDDPNNPRHGGHFMIMQTPDIIQRIEGIEFRNMGQQGLLGRYPIHFHLCDSVEGSIVSKNTIRESNQRCIVVHGTHNVTVSKNVAFNTKGHCYMTEDAGELDNVFIGNLGAYTRTVEKQISGDESDFDASTFWCTNPGNEWTENVAGGSEVNGFWFEVPSTVRGATNLMPLSKDMNPKKMAIKRFESNVAHSNVEHGLRTYPRGYQPEVESVFSNTRSYLNKKAGVFFHNSKNLALEGGVYADNEIQTDFDKADNIRFENAKVIGFSESNRKIFERERLSANCPRIGSEIHTFARDPNDSGAIFRGVSYSGFDDNELSNCGQQTVAFNFDDKVQTTMFDFWTTIEDVSISDGGAPISFCQAEGSDVTDVYITDLDSSLRPKGLEANGASTIMSDNAKMPALIFIDQRNCVSWKDRCCMYCINTCLRSITYAIDASYTEGYTLKVTDIYDSKDAIIDGSYYYEDDELSDSLFSKQRVYSVSLPPGKYKAEFFDKQGNPVWPTHVAEEYEAIQCPNSLLEGSVQLIQPDIREAECTELITNGSADHSNSEHSFWSHKGGGVTVAINEGRTGNAFADYEQSSNDDSIGQYLDTRCLKMMKGRQYEIKAYVKLEDATNALPYDCTNSDTCPKAEIRLNIPGEIGSGYLEVAREYVRPDAETSGWRLLQGIMTIEKQMAVASSAFFYIERNLEGVRMLLDDISISLLPEPACDKNLVMNGNFEDSSFWARDDDKQNTKLELISPGVNGDEDNAMELSRRRESWHSMSQDICIGCMKEGGRYTVTSRFQLRNGVDDSIFACDRTQYKGIDECPEMELQSWLDNGLDTYKSSKRINAANAAWPITTAGWNTMYGIYTASSIDEAADITRLTWDNLHPSKNLVVDDISIIHLPMNCKSLIVNGDFEYDNGRTAAFWENTGQDVEIDVVDVSQAKDESNHGVSLKVSRSGPGIVQQLDSRCLKAGTAWRIEVRIKLVNTSTGKGVRCSPTSRSRKDGCPHVTISGAKDGADQFEQRLYTDLTKGRWDADNLNLWRSNKLIVNEAMADSDSVSIEIRRFNEDWNVILDDFRMIPDADATDTGKTASGVRPMYNLQNYWKLHLGCFVILATLAFI